MMEFTQSCSLLSHSQNLFGVFYTNRLRLKMKIRCSNQMFSSSPLAAPLLLPSRMETHLWYVLPNEVKSEYLLRLYVDLLSPLEKDHVFSMRGEELRKGALLARALVRITIARYKPHVSPRSLEFRKNVHGKPEVIWKHNDDWLSPPLHFNLSHTSSLIACGVTLDSPIGIDVEEKQRTTKNNILSLARRYFSCEEVEVLTAISDPEVQHREFIKLWTLKDSAIVIEPRENNTDLTTDWEFALMELAGSHYAAICSRASNVLSEGKRIVPMKLTVWKTIPLVEDLCVSGTDAVVPVAGLT